MSAAKKRKAVSKKQPGTCQAPSALVRMEIDGTPVTVPMGTTILDAAASIGIPIPTLCSHPDLCRSGNCRICCVRVEGQDALQSACVYPIAEPIRVTTGGRDIRMARQHIVELLLAAHRGTCTTCRRSDNCELRALAASWGPDHLLFEKPEDCPEREDASMPGIVRDMDRCILCRRCVRTCSDLQAVGAFEPVGKGDDITVGTFAARPLKDSLCIACGQCVVRCPTAALSVADGTDRVFAALDDPRRRVVVSVSPFVSAAIAEEFGCPPGTWMESRLVTALRRCGFDAVYDAHLAGNVLTVAQMMALLKELWIRFNSLEDTRRPILSSACSAWVRWVEHFAPDVLDWLFPLRGPDDLMGALLRAHGEPDATIVAAVPCTACHLEIQRNSGTGAVRGPDAMLTTVELARMIRRSGIGLSSLLEGAFDRPSFAPTDVMPRYPAHGPGSAVASLFIETVTGSRADIRFEEVGGDPGLSVARLTVDATAEVPDWLYPYIPQFNCLRGDILFGRVSGTAAARRMLSDIRAGGVFSRCAFIEVSACPDGCAGGGGQPVPTSPDIRRRRLEAVHAAVTATGSGMHRLHGAALAVPDPQRLIGASFEARGRFLV